MKAIIPAGRIAQELGLFVPFDRAAGARDDDICERAGDQVTSIADQVIYLATGELPEDKRPKDTTSVYEVPGEGGFSEADE